MVHSTDGKPDTQDAEPRRRAFLRGAGTFAAGATLAVATAKAGNAPHANAAMVNPAPASAQPHSADATAHLRCHVPWRDSVSGLGDNAHRLAQRIAVASNGTVQLELTFGDRSSGGTSNLGNRADVDVWIEAGETERHPAAAFFTGLPGPRAMDAATLQMWLEAGGGQQLWDRSLADFDIKPLLIAHLGPEPGIICRARLDTPQQLARKIFGVVGAVADVARGLGASAAIASPATFSDAFAGDTLDGISWLGGYLGHADSQFSSATHLVGAGFAPLGHTLSLNVRRTVWERLDDTAQAAITGAAAEEYRTTVTETRLHHAILRGRLAAHDGVILVPATAELVTAIDRVSDAVIADRAAANREAHAINASYTAFRNQAMALNPTAGGSGFSALGLTS